MWEAVIGVCGTLAGVLLGWLLGKAKNGKLNFWFDNLYDEEITESENSKNIYYRAKFNLKLYNSGDKPAIAMDLKVVFKDSESNIVFEDKIYDRTKTKATNYGIFREKIDIVNLSGLTGTEIKAEISVNCANEQQIEKTKKIYLSYRNSKEKTKEILICNKDLEKCFKDLEKEKNNG